MNRDSYKSMAVTGCVLLLAACSGGSAGTTTTEVVDAVTTESLQSVSNLPDFDLTTLDAAAGANANLTAARSAVRHVVEEGREFSRAGCEARSHVDELKYQLNDLRSNLCIVKAMETEAGMTVGTGGYNYYEMTFAEGEAPGDGESEFTMPAFTARVRVGVIGEHLRMGLCTTESGDMTQQMAMTFGVEDGKFSGVMKNVYPSFLDPTATDGFKMEALLASDDPEEFAAGDTASFLAEMDTEWGAGSIALQVEKSNSGVIRNTVDAAFQSGSAGADWGSWISQAYGIYDNNEGCATWAAQGSFPAMRVADFFPPDAQIEIASEEGLTADDRFCWAQVSPEDCDADMTACDSFADFIEPAVDGQCPFEDTGTTECFGFELTEAGHPTSYVLSSEELEDADIFTEVEANSGLGEFFAPTIVFDSGETWNCEAEEGAAFVEIDPSAMAAAFTSCFAITEDTSRSIESCYDQHQEQVTEDEALGGEEFTEPTEEFGGDSEI